MIYKLTYSLAIRKNFYAVQSPLDIEEFNYILAYIQILREDLPVFPICVDSITPENCLLILKEFYDWDIFYQEREYDFEIDLDENWSKYCSQRFSNRKMFEKINKYPVVDAYIKILKIIQNEIIFNVSNNDYSIEGVECYELAIKQLDEIIQGVEIKAEWENKWVKWYNIAHESLIGKKFKNDSLVLVK